MKQRKIFVIEDEEADLLFYRKSLEKLGVKDALFFNTARDASEYLKSTSLDQKPDMILMDTNTQGMSGLEFLHWIKAQPSLTDVPVVAISSATSPSKIKELKDSGAIAFYNKPSGGDWRTMLESIFGQVE